MNTMNAKPRFGTIASLLATIAFCVYACGSPRALTHNELLTDGSSKAWKMVDYTVPDKKEPFPDCLRDNHFVFSSSGDFINDDGDVRCSKEGDARLKGTWTFSPDSTRLIIKGNGMQLNARIVELNASRLVLEELSADKKNTVMSISRFEAD
jgi:hypothetical protein